MLVLILKKMRVGRNQFLGQFMQIVRIKEELTVALLHVCKQLSEAGAILGANSLRHVGNELIDLLCRLERELVRLSCRIKRVFLLFLFRFGLLFLRGLCLLEGVLDFTEKSKFNKEMGTYPEMAERLLLANCSKSCSPSTP